MLDRGQEADWFASPYITSLALISAVSFVLLVHRELKHRSPLVDVRLLLDRNFGVAFASTLLTRREQFHQSRIVGLLQGMNPAYPSYAHHVAAALGSTPDSPLTLARIYQMAVQQATLLSYLDDFKVLGLVFLALLPLLLLVRRGTGGGRSVALH